MSEEKKGKEKKIGIKELYQSEKGRALLFFGFYIIFFIVLIVMLRTGKSNQEDTPSNNESNVSTEYKLENISSKNYEYKYLTTFNNNIYLYQGKRYQNKELFSLTTNNLTTSFYKDGDLFVTKINDKWELIEDPYVLNDFYDIDIISNILRKATFISKTEYQNKTMDMTFKISTTSLVDILTDTKIDLDDEANSIILKLDKDKNVIAIEYDLSPYTTYINTSSKSLIEIEYKNFGKVKEIEKP